MLKIRDLLVKTSIRRGLLFHCSPLRETVDDSSHELWLVKLIQDWGTLNKHFKKWHFPLYTTGRKHIGQWFRTLGNPNDLRLQSPEAFTQQKLGFLGTAVQEHLHCPRLRTTDVGHLKLLSLIPLPWFEKSFKHYIMWRGTQSPPWIPLYWTAIGHVSSIPLMVKVPECVVVSQLQGFLDKADYLDPF